MILLKTIYFDLILSFFKWSLILSITALKAAFIFFVTIMESFISFVSEKIYMTSSSNQYTMQCSKNPTEKFLTFQSTVQIDFFKLNYKKIKNA